MTVYMLDKNLWFPNPRLADREGVVAIGGDLSPERLILAYHLGIFPWYNEDEPIVWWSPDPRFVLVPGELKVRRSLRKIFKKNTFEIRYDTAFDQVIEYCGTQYRPDQDGTWLIPAMRDAYRVLHARGIAHSVEVFDREERLVGGLYGIALGRLFFGESMFHLVPDASKAALAALTLRYAAAPFIDCQVPNDFFRSMGARTIRRDTFLDLLAANVQAKNLWLSSKALAPRESVNLL